MEQKLPIQVLLLEEAKASPSNFERFCRSNGWHVETASLKNSAKELQLKNKFDVIIADCSMENIDCTELTRKIQNQIPEQPLIIVTQNGTVKEALDVLRQGASDYLQQPLDSEALNQAVRRIVSNQKSEEYRINQLSFLKNFSVTYNYSSLELAENPAQLPLLHELSRAGFIEDEEKLQVYLAFQEAITNSQDHGNLELESIWKEQFDQEGYDLYSITKKQRLTDPSFAKRQISWQFNYAYNQIEIIIKDSGKGFLKTESEICSQPKSVESNHLFCYGRGLPLIIGLMDFVEYKDYGRTLTMRKRINKITKRN